VDNFDALLDFEWSVGQYEWCEVRLAEHNPPASWPRNAFVFWRAEATEAGVSFPIVASLLGWSASTTEKMAKRYGHIGNDAHRDAVGTLDPATKKASKVGTESGTAEAPENHAKAVND
jgi:hypothetical protein